MDIARFYTTTATGHATKSFIRPQNEWEKQNSEWAKNMAS